MLTVSAVAGNEQQQLLEGMLRRALSALQAGIILLNDRSHRSSCRRSMAAGPNQGYGMAHFLSIILPLGATTGGEQQQPPQDILSGASTEGGTGSPQSQSSPLSSGAKAGIGAGVAVAVVALLSLLVFAAVKVSNLQAQANTQLSSCGT